MNIRMDKYLPKTVQHKMRMPDLLGDTVLPKRLVLDAFSTQIGWRPGGINSGQVKAFVQRFPKEFRYMAMGRVCLPYHPTENLPFVVPPEDGELKLPCPILATMNAIKFLIQNPDKWWPDSSKSCMHVVPTRGNATTRSSFAVPCLFDEPSKRSIHFCLSWCELQLHWGLLR